MITIDLHSAYFGVFNGFLHSTDNGTQAVCCEAVRSAILATAWLID